MALERGGFLSQTGKQSSQSLSPFFKGHKKGFNSSLHYGAPVFVSGVNERWEGGSPGGPCTAWGFQREHCVQDSSEALESYIRGLPFSTYAKFSGFLTPSLPLVRISRNLSVLSYAKIGHIFDTPPPPQRVRTKWKPPNSPRIPSISLPSGNVNIALGHLGVPPTFVWLKFANTHSSPRGRS